MANSPDLNEAMLALMAHRRSLSPLFLEGPAPNQDQIAHLLKLAARVPDHGKLAPWRFIIFADEARSRADAIFSSVFIQNHPDAPPELREKESRRFSQSPLVIAVVSKAAKHVKIPEWEQIMSAGAVCMNLTLAVRAMGLASTWLTDWIAYDPLVLAKLGLSSTEKIAGFIHIGHAKMVPEDRVRPDMALITHNF